MLNSRSIFIATILIFFLFRLAFIHTFPPFNDESIHLAWAKVMVETPEARFISMVLGGKQPLPFWLFGLAEKIIPSDPFLAGRLVTLLFSLAGLLGIFVLTHHIEIGARNRNTHAKYSAAAYIAGVAYALSPFAIMLDSQALMESMIFAVSVWSFYFLLKSLKKPSFSNALSLGCLLGVGFWLKSSMIIPILFTFITLIGKLLLTLINGKKTEILKQTIHLIIIAALFGLLLYPLVSHPSYQAFTRWNATYGFTLSDLLQFPIKSWLTNASSGVMWYFWYLTPPFLFGVLAVTRLSRLRLGLILWFMGWFIATCILARSVSSRYFFPSTFPLFILFGLSLQDIITKRRVLRILFLPILAFALLLVSSPPSFFGFIDRFSPPTDSFSMVSGWPSGYGVREAIAYIQAQTNNRTIILLIRHDSGNPEDAMVTKFLGNPQIKLAQIPLNLPKVMVDQFVENLGEAHMPIFFVTRGGQNAGLEEYITQVAHFTKPGGKEFVGVYKIAISSTLPNPGQTF